MFMENLPKRGPLFREFRLKIPPIWAARTRTLNILCTPRVLTPGGFFNIGPSRRGPNREGGLFTKLSGKHIFDSFSVLLSHILQN